MSAHGEAAVEALNKRFGKWSGQRAVHAKGIVCHGSFTPQPDARRLTVAEHMARAVDVTVRFSDISGDPFEADGGQWAYGMAVKFHLGDGAATDIVAVSLPSFIAGTPKRFLNVMKADLAVRAHPPSLAAGLRLAGYALPSRGVRRSVLTAARTRHKPPASYAALEYGGLHAFRWIDPNGTERYVRYRFLSDARAAPFEKRPVDPDYLQAELATRISGGIRFRLSLQFAEEGDSLTDVTQIWPDDRETLMAGRLHLTGLGPAPGQDLRTLSFDPGLVTDGIEPSEDPLLAMRSEAMRVSRSRRLGPT